MRVIAGVKRGLKLFDFEGSDIRPTTDRVKENIFNIIAQYVCDADVLDLFCGTGSLGIEAVSRGCANAVFCDSDARSLSLAKKNVCHAGFEAKCVFYQINALEFLKSTNLKFDIVFLDPPYNSGLCESALSLIFEKDILKGNGIAVVERDETDNFSFPEANLIKEKKYGRTYINIYSNK